MKMGLRFWSVLCALLYMCILGCDEAPSTSVVSGPLELGVITGRVSAQGADGQEGILIEIVGMGITQTTASDGSFRMEVNLAAIDQMTTEMNSQSPLMVELRFTKTGYASATQMVSVQAGVVAELPEPVLMDPLPGSITGRLVFPTGLNPADFQVGVQLSLVPTDGVATAGAYDEMGSFGFDDLAPSSYRVEVSGAPFVAVGLPVIIGPGQAVAVPDITLRLQDNLRTQYETAIEGVARLQGVTDEAAHGGIFVEDMDGETSTTTRADGRFRLVVEPGTHTLRFSRAGYGATEVSAGEVSPRTRVTLPETVVLTARPGRVTGRVRLVQFETVGRLQATDVHLYGEDPDPVATVQPDANGRFSFDQVAFGEWRVEARLPAYTTRSTWVQVDPGRHVETGELALVHASQTEAAVLLAGQVTLQGLADMSGTNVRVVTVPDQTPFSSTVTDSQGRFAISASENERYRIVLERANYVLPENWGPFGYDTAQAGFLDEDGNPAEMELAAIPGEIRGTVLLPAQFEAPAFLERVRVSLWAPEAEIDAEPIAQVRLDAQGNYRFNGITAGNYHLHAEAEGFVTQRNAVFVPAGGRVIMPDILLQLMEAQVGEGGEVVVTAIEGQARLQGVLDPNGHGGIRVESVGTPFATVTTSDGRFRLTLIPGPHVLRVSQAGYGVVQVQAPSAVNGQTTSLDDPVVLAAQPGRISGEVRLLQYGDPRRLQAVDIRIIGADEQVVAQTQPNADGRFVAPNVAPGAYTVAASAIGYETRVVPAEIRPGAAVNLPSMDLRHDSEGPGAVTLQGRARRTDSTLHAGSVVRAFIGDLPYRITQTDASGAFEMSASLGERYSLRIERAGYQDVELDAVSYHLENQRFQVDDAAIDVTLNRLGAPIRGRITARVEVADQWLPPDDRHVRVRLRGLAGSQHEDVVNRATADEPAVFNDVPPGRYLVLAERSGFVSSEAVTVIDDGQLDETVDPLRVVLEDLAQARLQLDGLVIAACDLRGSLALRNADLSRTVLRGDIGQIQGGVCPSCPTGNEPACGPLELSGADLSSSDLTGLTGAQGARLDQANLFGADLMGVDLTGAGLAGTNLVGSNLEGAIFINANLRSADLSDANLQSAVFSGDAWRDAPPVRPCAANIERPGVNLEGAELNGANLRAVRMAAVYMLGADLGGARLREADFTGACLQDGIFNLSDLSDADFDGADLRRSRMANAVLDNTSMAGADLRDSMLAGAVLETTDFACRLRDAQGACTCELAFGGQGDADFDALCHDDAEPDPRCNCRTRLSEANLAGANVLGVDFTGADMTNITLLGAAVGDSRRVPAYQPSDCSLPDGCDWESVADCPNAPAACQVSQTRFVQARLNDAVFTGLQADHINFESALLVRAQLAGSAFSGSTWHNTNLSEANLNESDLSGSHFPGTNFERASLRRADVTNIEISNTTSFAYADLTDADLSGSDLRGARFDGATLESIIIAQSKICFYRPNFVGEPAVFDPACGPWGSIIPAGSTTWEFDDGVSMEFGVEYAFEMKTSEITFGEVTDLLGPGVVEPFLADRNSAEFWLNDFELSNGCANRDCILRSYPALFGFGPRGRGLAVAFMNAASIRDGYRPCFLNPLGEVYNVEDARAAAPYSWPRGLDCEGYRFGTRAELEFALTDAGNFSLATREFNSCEDIQVNFAQQVNRPSKCSNAASPVCVHFADISSHGVCDLFGNLGEAGVVGSPDSCKDGDTSGTRFVLDEPISVGAAFNILIEEFLGRRANLQTWFSWLLDGPGGGMSPRPVRTIFEACNDGDQEEARACGQGELGQSIRICNGQYWSVWGPCDHPADVCPE